MKHIECRSEIENKVITPNNFLLSLKLFLRQMQKYLISMSLFSINRFPFSANLVPIYIFMNSCLSDWTIFLARVIFIERYLAISPSSWWDYMLSSQTHSFFWYHSDMYVSDLGSIHYHKSPYAGTITKSQILIDVLL